jgi:uncharacterized protein (DUF1778 family)
MAKNSQKKIQYNNAWTNERFDRINIAVKKGQKETIKQRADGKGKSINSYIVDLIEADLSLNNAQQDE